MNQTFIRRVHRFWGPNRNASKSRAWMIRLNQPFVMISNPIELKQLDRIGTIVEYRFTPLQFILPTRNPFSNTLHARFR